MVFHGNNKTADELRYALAEGIGVIVLDNEDEISRLDKIAGQVAPGRNESGTKVPVMLRLNPGPRSRQDQHRHCRLQVWLPVGKTTRGTPWRCWYRARISS